MTPEEATIKLRNTIKEIQEAGLTILHSIFIDKNEGERYEEVVAEKIDVIKADRSSF